MIQRSILWWYDIVGKNILDKICIVSPDLQAPDCVKPVIDSRIATRWGCYTVGRLCAGKRGEWSIRKLEKVGWKKPPWKHDVWNDKCVCFFCRITCVSTVYYVPLHRSLSIRPRRLYSEADWTAFQMLDQVLKNPLQGHKEDHMTWDAPNSSWDESIYHLNFTLVAYIGHVNVLCFAWRINRFALSLLIIHN